MKLHPRLLDLLGRATLPQAARLAEQAAHAQGLETDIGGDQPLREDPVRFVASDRMAIATGDLVEAAQGEAEVRITTNVLGLAGATPALPPAYSELQLQRRRARDFALARFFNVFDHRALSFFYRIARKFRWPLLAERAGRGGHDPVARMVAALGGFGTDQVRQRLDVTDALLVPLVPHLGDVRRSAASVQTVLRLLTGLDLRVVQATPAWMAVPPAEQTRIGGALGQFAQLGEGATSRGDPAGGAAMLGASVLDVQHQYLIEIGPLDYVAFKRFCAEPGARRIVSQLAVLAAGIEHRASIRLLIAPGAVPPLQLGAASAPALLGWTTWISAEARETAMLADCIIPMERVSNG
jgi:type VI secretion system protein ImpH